MNAIAQRRSLPRAMVRSLIWWMTARVVRLKAPTLDG